MPARARHTIDRSGLLHIILAAVLIAFMAGSVSAQPRFPSLTGRIVDGANLLSAEDRAKITTDLQALQTKSTDQVVVVTVPSLQGYAIEEYGYQLGRAWKIGQEGVNNGVLLIVAPNERKVRIEVGRGLEPQLTDAMSSLIVQNALLPAFRRGDWAGGIRAGVRDIVDVLSGDAEAVKDRLARGTKRTSQQTDWETLLPLLIWLAIVGFIIYQQYRAARSAPATASGRRRSGFPDDRRVIIFPSGSGNWGGSGGGFGSGGGGGFSGGGGDFGGGGSSGSW